MSILQVVFRFLRIILLIRKAQTFKKINSISQIKTSAEKIIDILSEIKELIQDVDTKLDLDYCIDKIASNQLYQAAFFEDDDAAEWVNQGR